MNVRAAALREILTSVGGPLAVQVGRAETALAEWPADAGLLLEWAGNLRVTRNLALNTAALYLQHATAFFAWCRAEGREPLKSAPADIEAWLRFLLIRRELGPASRSLALTGVRQFFDWHEISRGQVSPARNIRGPKRTKTVARRYSPRVLKALFGVCDRATIEGKRDYALLLMLWATGARRSEASALTLSQLELHERSGSVQFLGKGAKERVVPFDKRLVDALMDWLVARDELRGVHDRERVWLNLKGRDKGTGMGPKGIESLLRRIGKKARVTSASFGAHKFRVTFATDLYDDGVDIEAIRRLLGHESIETTRKYIAVSQRMQSYKLPTSRIDEVIGADKQIPRWIQRKL